MTTLISPSSADADRDALAARQARNTFRTAIILSGASVATAAVEIYLALQLGAWQLYLAIGILLTLTVLTLVSALLSRRGRADWGAGLLIGAMLVAIVMIASLLAGMGLPVGLAALLATVAISTQTLPQHVVNRAMMAGVIAGVLAGLLDLLGTPFQLVVPELQAIAPFIIVGTMLIYGFLVARQFPTYSAPSKLMVAFLTVTVISVGSVAVFSDRAIRTTLVDHIGAELKGQAQLQASAVGDLLARQVDVLQAVGLSELIQNAVEEANAGYRGEAAVIQADIEGLDQQWRSADEAGDDSDPLVQARLNNEVASELREFRAAFSENVEVFVTDKYGANVAVTNRTSDYYQADEEWWQAAFDQGRGATYVGQPEYDASSATLASNIAIPVYRSGTQEVIGVLRTTVRLEAVTELLEVGEEHFVHVRLLLPDGSWLGADGVSPAPPEFVTALRAAALDTYVELPMNGVPGLVGQSPVSSLDPEEASIISRLGWTVVVHQDQDESLVPVDTQARGSLLIAVVIAGAMAGAAIGMGYLLTAPVARLTAVARQAAAGDLNVQAQAESTPEINLLAMAFNSMTARLRDLIGSLEARVEARTEQLRASVDVGRAAVSVLDPARLFSEVTDLISARFGFYYAALFTLDEAGEFAVLRAATGEAGRILKERGHKLQVGGESMVGTAVATRKPRIALDVGEEPMRFANPLLPETRSEIALPLAVGDRVFGALDVQSTQEAAFDETSAAVLQSMADQVAIALNNATSYAEAQAAVQRSHALYLASQQVGRLEVDPETAIEEMLRAVSETQGFSQWWVVVLDERREQLMPIVSSLRVGQSRAVRVADQRGSPVIRSAVDGETHIINDPVGDPRMGEIPADRRSGIGKFVSVPILSRGTPTGALAFGRSVTEADLSDRDIEVAQSLASLVALALENRKLFDRTRRALDDLDAINRRLTDEAWTSFSRRLSGNGVMWVGAGSADDPALLPEIGEALALGRIVVRPFSKDGSLIVAVPIQLRGAPVGALRLNLPEHAWSSEVAATLESIAGHVAQAAENARLIEMAEDRARRERALTESTDKIRRAADMERILQTAAEELARHLNATRVAVRVGVGDDDPANGGGRSGNDHAAPAG